jgi:ketosteroid isomerase-like protein
MATQSSQEGKIMKIVTKKSRPASSGFAIALWLLIASGMSAAPVLAKESVLEDHPAALAASQLAEAIKAGDVDMLSQLIGPDVLIFESGGVESSLAEYETHHMLADIAFMKAMNSEVISRRVIEAGESVIVMTQSRLTGVYKDKEMDLSSTETLVMEKTDGHWKIVHIHWSSK